MIYSIVPVPKPRMTHRDRWAKRACVLRYHRFKDQVRLRRVVLPEPCRVVFWLSMPASWNDKKCAAHDGQLHRSRPDLDNLIKALLDALHRDDSHIAKIDAEKRWTSGVSHFEVIPLGSPLEEAA